MDFLSMGSHGKLERLGNSSALSAPKQPLCETRPTSKELSLLAQLSYQTYIAIELRSAAEL